MGLFEGLVGKFCFLPILFNDLCSFLAIFIIHTETSDENACKSCSDCAMLYAFLEVLSSCQCWAVKWLWSSGRPKSSKTSTVYTVHSTEIIGERWWRKMDPIAGDTRQEYHWTTFHSGSTAEVGKHNRVRGNSTDNLTNTELKTWIQTKVTRGCSAGGVRWRNTGEGKEWKNPGNGDGEKTGWNTPQKPRKKQIKWNWNDRKWTATAEFSYNLSDCLSARVSGPIEL